MAKKLMTAAEIFKKCAPKFAKIELVLGGLKDPENPWRFHFLPARGGVSIVDRPWDMAHPHQWPWIDLQHVKLKPFPYCLSDVPRDFTPVGGLEHALFAAMRTWLFIGRTFKLDMSFESPRGGSYMPLKIVMAGGRITGWCARHEYHIEGSADAFLPPGTPEREAYDKALMLEEAQSLKAHRRSQGEISVTDAADLARAAQELLY